METGISRKIDTGRLPLLDADTHLEQSIGDILTTPVATRVMRPEYGSDVPRLIDQPMCKGWQLRVFAAIAAALDKWEPRISLNKVKIGNVGVGCAEIALTYTIKESGETKTMSYTASREAA